MAVTASGRSRFLLPAAGALLASMLPLTAPATASAAPAGQKAPQQVAQRSDGCPVSVAVADVRTGAQGYGLTVVRGTTPERFNVEVLGTLDDALGPGRHLILVQVSDVKGKTVIGDRGIWAGMSGSPVYVDGKFLGAIGYGFSAGGTIGGVTPAADMLRLLGPTAAKGPATAPYRVPLGPTGRAQLPRHARGSGAALERLPMPLGLSGLNSRRLRQFSSASAKSDAAVIPYAAGSGGRRTSASDPATAELKPGGNFAATLSYGDVSATAVGTTSVVCRGQALAFGHPFEFTGAVSYGAHDAHAVAVVPDHVRGSYKIANLGALAGTVDQDRGAAIRAKLGAGPSVIPVRTSINVLDLNRRRVGGVQVAESRYLGPITAYGILAGIDVTADQVGRGSSKVTWTIRGTRRNGRPFSVTRSDRWASADDMAFDPAVDLAITLDSLLNNPYEPVKITSVNYAMSATTTLRRMRVVSALVSVNGGRFVSPTELRVRPGDTVRVRTKLQPYQGKPDVVVERNLRVPAGSSGRFGVLRVIAGGSAGGPDGGDCLFDEDGCASGEGQTTIDGLLAAVRNRPGNNTLEVSLELEGNTPDARPLVTKQSEAMPQVVTGYRDFAVQVR